MTTQQILRTIQDALDELYRRTNFNTTTTTVGAAGSADALPANPDGYIRLAIGTETKLVPFYSET